MALHTDIPTRAEIEALVRARAASSVSIYLPTTPFTRDAQMSRIELKNAADEAIGQLRAAGADSREVAGIEDSLEDLVDDSEFWRLQSHSLAVFATPARVQTFRLANRLSAAVEVSDRFHLKPLLRAVTFPQAAFVLALAQGSVRLLEITPDEAPFEVRVDDMPRDIASAVGKSSISDRSPSRRMQGVEGQKVRMRQYSRQIDAALRPVLSGLDLPLILASTEPLEAVFRSVTSYPHLADEGIPGNPETISDSELGDAARSILDGMYDAELAALADRFAEREPQGRASTDLTDVARAATFGAVDTVLVDIDEVVPGFVDEESGAVTLTPDDDALNYGVTDEIARRVLLGGGRVLAVRREDIPRGGSIAAILRYPV